MVSKKWYLVLKSDDGDLLMVGRDYEFDFPAAAPPLFLGRAEAEIHQSTYLHLTGELLEIRRS